MRFSSEGLIGGTLKCRSDHSDGSLGRNAGSQAGHQWEAPPFGIGIVAFVRTAPGVELGTVLQRNPDVGRAVQQTKESASSHAHNGEWKAFYIERVANRVLAILAEASLEKGIAHHRDGGVVVLVVKSKWTAAGHADTKSRKQIAASHFPKSFFRHLAVAD